MILANAISTIRTHESGIKELPVTSPIGFVDDFTLATDDCRLHLSDEGVERLCGRFAAPAAYLNRLDADVRRTVLQRHFDHDDLAADHLTLISRGGEFLGFGRADLLRISGQEVFEAVQDGVQKDLAVHSLDIADESIQADLLVERASAEVVPGDIIQAGMRVTHSLIGDYATSIESFILRLVCANGLTHRECSKRESTRTRRLSVEHKDARQLQIAQVRRLANGISAALEKKLSTIRELHSQAVDVDQILTRWLERAHLSIRLWLPVLRRAWEQEGSQATAYGVMNALTRVATHEQRVSPRQRRIMSGLAGLLAFQRIHICPHCFSHLGGPRSHSEGLDVHSAVSTGV